MKIYLVKTLAENVHVLEYESGDCAIWMLVKLRKEARCIKCWGDPIAKGEQAYRPIANGDIRSNRLCVACVSEIMLQGPDAEQRTVPWHCDVCRRGGSVPWTNALDTMDRVRQAHTAAAPTIDKICTRVDQITLVMPPPKTT